MTKHHLRRKSWLLVIVVTSNCSIGREGRPKKFSDVNLGNLLHKVLIYVKSKAKELGQNMSASFLGIPEVGEKQAKMREET